MKINYQNILHFRCLNNLSQIEMTYLKLKWPILKLKRPISNWNDLWNWYDLSQIEITSSLIEINQPIWINTSQIKLKFLRMIIPPLNWIQHFHIELTHLILNPPKKNQIEHPKSYLQSWHWLCPLCWVLRKGCIRPTALQRCQSK